MKSLRKIVHLVRNGYTSHSHLLQNILFHTFNRNQFCVCSFLLSGEISKIKIEKILVLERDSADVLDKMEG